MSDDSSSAMKRASSSGSDESSKKQKKIFQDRSLEVFGIPARRYGEGDKESKQQQ